MALDPKKHKKGPKGDPASQADAQKKDRAVKPQNAAVKKKENGTKKRKNRAQRRAAAAANAELVEGLASLSIVPVEQGKNGCPPAVPAQPSGTIEPRALPKGVPSPYPCLECVASAVHIFGEVSDHDQGCFMPLEKVKFGGLILRYASELMHSFAEEHTTKIPGDKEERRLNREFIQIPVQIAIFDKQRQLNAAREKAEAETAEIQKGLSRLQT